MRDANDAFVGVALWNTPGGNLYAARSIGGSVVVFSVFVQQGIILPIAHLYFDSADCTGPVFVSTSNVGFLPLVAGSDPNNPDSGYYPIEFPNSDRAYGSRVDYVASSSGCSGTFLAPHGCCSPSGPGQFANIGQAASFSLSALALVPPFHVDGP